MSVLLLNESEVNKMDNVIEYHEDFIGYRKSLIKHYRHELAYISEDKQVENYILADITELIMKLEEDENITDGTLLRVFSHPMGGYGYVECEITDIEK